MLCSAAHLRQIERDGRTSATTSWSGLASRGSCRSRASGANVEGKRGGPSGPLQPRASAWFLAVRLSEFGSEVAGGGGVRLERAHARWMSGTPACPDLVACCIRVLASPPLDPGAAARGVVPLLTVAAWSRIGRHTDKRERASGSPAAGTQGACRIRRDDHSSVFNYASIGRGRYGPNRLDETLVSNDWQVSDMITAPPVVIRRISVVQRFDVVSAAASDRDQKRCTVEVQPTRGRLLFEVFTSPASYPAKITQQGVMCDLSPSPSGAGDLRRIV